MAISASSPLKLSFFRRDAEQVAQDLLGRTLCRRLAKRNVLRGRIVETEAYLGESDQASHARFGPTRRNRVMYGAGGKLYVYLIYGMHHCLNVVTGQSGDPQAVLLRAIELPDSSQRASGPGRLCATFEIGREFDGQSPRRDQLWFEEGSGAKIEVGRTARIGVDYAGEWASRDLRFIVEHSAALSGSKRLNAQSSSIR